MSVVKRNISCQDQGITAQNIFNMCVLCDDRTHTYFHLNPDEIHKGKKDVKAKEEIPEIRVVKTKSNFCNYLFYLYLLYCRFITKVFKFIKKLFKSEN
ncbi:unnamed protein product [marine sediment metagenome]|uniref:Uncharacterized protein n=1 Tax=marine sediment metagenome TaxID=412755 RepID=X1BV00_9ZZZZ